MTLRKILFLFAVFALTPSVWGVIFTSLYSFSGTNGGNPAAALIQATDGLLYGTTEWGGSNATATFTGNGTVFKITTNGVLTPLVYFSGANGYNPHAGLIQVSNAFYGTTYLNGGGSVFRMTTNGSLTNVVWFNSTGSTPTAKLTDGGDGFLYGTLAEDGQYSDGAIFRTTTNVAEQIQVSLNGSNGRTPQSPLVLARDGNFYGTAGSGGSSNLGVVFRYKATGPLFSNILSFTGINGAHPYAGLIQATDGYLYGTTEAGGAFSLGTIFRVDTSGVLNTLVDFNGTNGANPFNGLIQANDGYFYGVTTSGGSGFSGGNSGNGTIFRMDTNGTLTTLFLFNITNGWHPSGELIQSSDGTFYGTTAGGGTNLGWGTVFKFSIAPSPAFKSVTQTNGSWLLLWSAVAGQNYQVQYNSDLNKSHWSNLGTSFTATNSAVTTLDTNVSVSSRFYRVVMSP